MSFSGLDNGDGQILPNNYMEIGIITGSNEASAIRITHTSNTPGTGSIEMFKPLAVTGNATVGGTLTVTNAATLGGGEIVNRKVVQFDSSNVTNRYTSDTVTIKKLVLAGSFPDNDGNTIQIRTQDSGLSSSSKVATLNIFVNINGPTGPYRWRCYGEHDKLSDGTIRIAFIENDRNKAFVIYIEYYDE